MSDDRPLLPPRKRDWKHGTPQVGVFVRTGDGAVIQMCSDRASPDELAFALSLVRGVRHLPEDAVRPVRDEWKASPLMQEKQATKVARRKGS